MKIYRREATESDIPFIYQLKKEALYPYVDAIWDWDEVFQKKRFTETLCLGRIDILLIDSEPIGMLEIEEREKRIELINIEIIEPLRGKGIGTKIIRELLDEARSKGKPVGLRVFKENTGAIGLYKRIGFQVCGESEHHLEMGIPSMEKQ